MKVHLVSLFFLGHKIVVMNINNKVVSKENKIGNFVELGKQLILKMQFVNTDSWFLDDIVITNLCHNILSY